MTETATPRKKLAIIDGKSVFYRGYYAMPNLATKDGTPTGGVFGFATMALEVIRRLKPDYVAVAWDKPKTNIRRRLELYPAYKAGRKPTPEDFKAQIPVLQELLQAFGWPLYEMDDYEADDIMGTLALQATAQDIETMLITSDLDMLQLIDPHVHVYALKKGLSNIELFSPQTLEAKYGIRVDQMLDLKALKGDSSDNIPGVPGVGEKTAVQLLQQYGTLDNIYDNLGLLKDSLRKKLEAGKDLAYLSKELGAIWTNAPLTLNLDEVDGSMCDPAKVADMLQRLEFRSLVRQLPEIMQVAGESLPNTSAPIAVGQNVMIDSADQLPGLVEELGKSDRFVVHSRSAGKHGKNPRLLIISPGGAGKTFMIRLTTVPAEAVAEALGSYFADENIKKIGHDIKSTIQVLFELGMDINGIGHDTQIGAFLLDALRRDLSLTDLAANDLGYDGSPFEDSDDEELASRAAEIVAVIAALTLKQVAELQKLPRLSELAKTVEWPVIKVLAGMEYTGMRLDSDYLAKFAVEIDHAVEDLEHQIYDYAGEEVNLGSPSQLAEVLFTKLDLPTAGIKKGKTGYSTAASELDKLRGQHPVIDLITQYREVAKLKNTYVDTLPKQVDEQGRIHTTFNLTIAQTGRLSSTDPNLQNIPTRTDLGRRIRTAFVAGPGNKFVSADYSQFELRLAAVMANDEELIDMFNRGADIHTATAALVYGRQVEDVTKGMRRAAKVINFGILYGMSPHGLSIATGMDRQQAVTFIEKYKKVRKPLFDYMDRTKQLAREQGYVETLHGRRRPMPDIHSGNFIVRQSAERAAINMPIQGTEADLMKLAMIAVDRELPEGATQLLQVHDSILLECREELAEDVGRLLKQLMQDIYKLPVRLDVDVTIADDWGAL